MKSSPSSLSLGFFFTRVLLLSAALALFASQSARAATEYWEPTGTTGTNASGTWTTATTTLDWNTDSTGVSTPLTYWLNGNDAIFSADPAATALSTVTLGSAISANSLTFGNSGVVGGTTSSLGATGGYTFTNANTLTLGNATTGNAIITMASGVGPVTFQGAITLATPGSNQTYTIVNNSSNTLTFGGTIAETSANTITLAFNGTGGVTFNAAINGNSTTNPSGNVILNLAGSQAISMNATTNAAGQINVNATSTLNVGSALAIQGFNLNLVNGSTVNFTNGITAATIAGFSGVGGTLTLTNTTSQAVALTLQGVSLGNADQQLDQNPTSATNINGLGSVTVVGVSQGGNNTNYGTETLTGVLSFTGTGGLNVANTGSTGPGSGNSNGPGTGLTLVLQGSDTYTGPTAVSNGATLTVNAGGSIANSSGYTVTKSTFNLAPNAANTADMLNTSGTVTLSAGGATPATATGVGSSFNVTGNTTNNVTETFASLVLGAGSPSTVTITPAAGEVTTLAAANTTNSFIRGAYATGLIRGTNLNQTTTTNVARFLLGDNGASLGLVGSGTLNNASAADATQGLSIVPYLIGDTSVSGNGSNFLTYDSTLGLRVLTAAEDTVLTAASVTAAAPVNAVGFNGTLTSSTGITVNSLLFNTSGQTLNGSGGALTVNSGAVATVGTSTTTDTIGGGFSSLTLGNGEGVITVTSGNTLTVNTAVAVTGGSNDLIKSGAGTLVLNGLESYAGPTIVNQGTLDIGGTDATATTLASGATLGASPSSMGIVSGNVNGNGNVAVTSGTLALSGSNSYTGTTVVSAGAVLQAVALTGNTSTGGTSAALSPTSALELNSSGTTAATSGLLQLRSDNNVTFTTLLTSSAFTGSGASNGQANNLLLNSNAVAGNFTIDVGAATSASNKVITFGTVVFSTGGTGDSDTLNVTGSNGYTLSLGAVNSNKNHGDGLILNPTTANLIIASYAGSNNAADFLTFTGSNTTVTGNITTNGKPLTVSFNQAGTVTLDGNNTDNNNTFAINSGTLVLNNNLALALSGSNVIGTGSASTNNVTVLLGGTNASGLGGGVTVANNLATSPLDTGTITLGGQNTSGTNAFTGTITTGSGGVNNNINLAEAGGGVVNFGVIANSAPGTGVITINGGGTTGTVGFKGVDTYTGATNVNGGTLLLQSGGSLAGTAVTVGTPTQSGTLQVSGNYTIGTSGTAGVTLTANTGTLSLVDGSINTLTIGGSNSTLTFGGNNNLNLEVSGAMADEVLLAGSGQTASVTGTDFVNLTVLSPVTSGTDILISAPGNGLLSGSFVLGTVSGVPFVGSQTLVDTGTTLLLVSQANATPATAYFTGTLGTSWSAISGGSNVNFTTDSAGTINANQVPGATTNVHFYATNANTANVANSVLGANFTINSLTVDGTALGESGAVGIGGSNTLTIVAGTANGNTLGNGIAVNGGAGPVTISAPVVLGGSNTFTNNSSNSFVISGGISGAFPLTFAGSGTTILTGTESYTGVTTILAASTLQIGNGGVAGNLPTTTVTDNGNLVFNSSSALTESTAISGSGRLTMNGPGTLTITTGNNVDTYSGATVINSGTLAVTGAGGQQGALAGTPTITVNNGGTLLINGAGSDILGYTTGKEQLVINSGGTVLNIGNNSRQTISNPVLMTGGTLASANGLGDGNGSYSLSVTSGTGVIATSDAFGNAATISADFSQQGASSIINVTRGIAVSGNNPDLLISGQIINYQSNAYALTFNGNGITRITGTNTFTGGTILGNNGGIVQISSTGALGRGTASDIGTNIGTIASGYQLLFAVPGSGVGSSAANPNVIANAFTMNSQNSYGNAGVTGGYADIENVSGFNKITGPVTIVGTGGTGANVVSDSGNLELSGTLSSTLVNANTRVFDFSGAGNGTVSGSIVNAPVVSSSSTQIGVLKDGAGTWALTGSNTYSGGTTINNGVLQINNANSLGAATSVAAITGGTLEALNSISETRNYTVTGTTGVIQVDGSANTYTINGSIGGSGGLTSAGAGTLALTNTNNFSGATTVNGGTLLLGHAGTAGAAAGGTLTQSTSVNVNAGTLLISASNALGTNTAAVNINAGTLLINATNAISASTAVNLNGATLKTAASAGSGATSTGNTYDTSVPSNPTYDGGSVSGSTTGGMGALTLSGASTLDFGVGSGTSGNGETLVFSSFNGTGTLNVINYTNSTAANSADANSGINGTDDRLIFNTTGAGLSSSQLSQISFNGVNDAVQILLDGNNYEVTAGAVPEPTTIFAGLLLVGFIGYRERRRMVSLYRLASKRS